MNLSPTVETTVTNTPTFAEVLERLWVTKHTGPILVHFAGGRPGTVEILPPSERIRLDNGRE